MELERISLREDERGLLVGGTESGKSMLGDWLTRDFLERYPDGRVLVVDSKPRYKAEYTLDGAYAGRLYLSWKRGQYLPGAVVVANANQMRQAYGVGYRLVVAQLGYQGATLKDLLGCLRAFYDARKYHHRLAQVDEAMDFYGPTGMPREADDIMNRCSRSGREHGLAMLYCSQRTRAFSTTVLEEMSKLYAFRLDFVKDAERYEEMGAPEFPPIKQKHRFMYWTKHDYNRIWGPYTLDPRMVSQMEAGRI